MTMKIAYAVTVPMSARFALQGQLSYLKSRGHIVSLTSSPGLDLSFISEHEKVEVYAIKTEREISILYDLITLWSYWRHWREVKPDITNVGTPKAGFIAGLAAWIACVPMRVYTLHGLRLETTTGVRRHLLLTIERITCACSHRVICVSPSLRDEVLRLNICSAKKLVVLGNGSANGVDFTLYADTPQDSTLEELRQKLGIPEESIVIGFVGRFTKDKGIKELVEAFLKLRIEFLQLKLLLVGDFEVGDPVDPSIRVEIEKNPDIIITGFVNNTSFYYHLMDVLALPTYREGLPGTPLEAAAAGIPVVTTNVTGAKDAVLHEQTGLIVNRSDTKELIKALRRFLNSSKLRSTFGNAGSAWVKSAFSPTDVWKNIEEFYIELPKALKLKRKYT